MNNVITKEDIELYKRKLWEEEDHNKRLIQDRYLDLVPKSTALTTNGRAIPLDLLMTDKSVLLYCYLQLKSNWNDDETHRYIWREYYKIRPLLEQLKGKYSKLSSTATVSKKLKELTNSKYIEEQNNALLLNNTYFDINNGSNYSLINQDTLIKLVDYKDELLIRIYIWYVWLFYRNNGKAFVCFDETLFNHINYSYQSKNKLRLKEIRTLLLKDGFIEMASVTRIDHTTGLLKTINAIGLLKV